MIVVWHSEKLRETRDWEGQEIGRDKRLGETRDWERQEIERTKRLRETSDWGDILRERCIERQRIERLKSMFITHWVIEWLSGSLRCIGI